MAQQYNSTERKIMSLYNTEPAGRNAVERYRAEREKNRAEREKIRNKNQENINSNILDLNSDTNDNTFNRLNRRLFRPDDE